MVLEWDKIGAAITGLVIGIGGFFGGRVTRKADTGAEVAQANAAASVADAEGTLYNRLREEIDALRNDVSRLRADLDVERRHGRALELHVWKLERIMRDAGLTPPPFVEPGNVANETTDQSPH